jgi:hypothetical protein
MSVAYAPAPCRFVVGVHWPVSRASLAALADLGMSITQIADYHAVEPADVWLRLGPCLGMRKPW